MRITGHTSLLRRSVMVGGLVAGMALSAVAIRAYVTSGYTWASRQVPYYVNPINYSSLDEGAVEAEVRAAADAWSQQTNADFQYYYAGRTTGTSATRNSKNEVFFRNESNGTNGAVTYWWYDGSGHLVDFDIIFYDGSYFFFTGPTGCSGGLYVQDLATHEFGHGLGLRHTSVSGATMTPTTGWCSQSWRTLEADDITGIESLYPSGGGTTSTPPSPPSNLSARQDSASPSSAIDVSWADPNNEEQVLMERSANGGTWMQIATLPANLTSYRDTGLAAASTYAYRSRAANSVGFSDYSNTSSASTAAPSAPGVPTNPTPSSGASNVSWDTTLMWTATNAEKFNVYFGTSSDPPLFASNVTSTSLALSKLAQGTTFYWKIAATNAVGTVEGPVWSFKTKTRGKK